MVGLYPVLVQSVTEFFPVSSGAHLLLFCKGVVTPELLHLGTIIPVVIYFRKMLFKHFFTISIATVPTMIVGFVIKKFSSYYSMQGLIKWGMLFGALFLLFAEFSDAKKSKVSFREAFLIGLMQCLAFIPGFSRLGATLAGARLVGIERGLAAEFSFLLSIPTVLGAIILTPPTITTLALWTPYIALEALVGWGSLYAFMHLNSRALILMIVFYRLFLFWTMF